MYMCEGLAVPPSASPPSPGSLVAAGEPDPNSALFMNGTIDVFNLHSRFGAGKVILLDFTGHKTVNTYWNSRRRPVILSPPYDIDGNTTAFSSQERANIYAIWRAVAEDYGARLRLRVYAGCWRRVEKSRLCGSTRPTRVRPKTNRPFALPTT
jgi:hypothetical protein